jgi:hypothetical protein
MTKLNILFFVLLVSITSVYAATLSITAISTEIPTILCKLTIINEATSNQEYQYRWWVTNVSTGQYTDPTVVDSGAVAKVITAGGTYSTTETLTVPRAGTYYCKAEVFYGTERSGAADQFSASEPLGTVVVNDDGNFVPKITEPVLKLVPIGFKVPCAINNTMKEEYYFNNLLLTDEVEFMKGTKLNYVLINHVDNSSVTIYINSRKEYNFTEQHSECIDLDHDGFNEISLTAFNIKNNKTDLYLVLYEPTEASAFNRWIKSNRGVVLLAIVALIYYFFVYDRRKKR